MSDQTLERIAIVAPLEEGATPRARKLVAQGPPFDPRQVGLRKHAVYFSSQEAVFVFEGPDAGRRVADLVDDMVVSATFSAWGPLLAGTPRLAHQAYFWEDGQDATADPAEH